MAASRDNPALADIGNIVIIASLVLQLLWFALFCVVAAIFHRRMRMNPTTASTRPGVRWETHLHTLYLVSALIMVCSLFRVIEYIQGQDGYLLTTKVFLYVFDALPMFIVVAWLHWKHLGEMAVLLRGEVPCAKGFPLVSMRPKFSGFAKTQSS
jgi:hypothetical protein